MRIPFPFARTQMRRRQTWTRGIAAFAVVAGVSLAMLFGNSPTAKGYAISNTNEVVTTTGGGGYIGPANCPTGSVIYQMGATGDSGNTSLTRPVGTCADLNGPASLHSTVTGSIGTTSWGGAGNTTLTPVRCSSAQAVVGMVVHKQANGYVAGWQLMCGSLPTGESRTTDSVTFGWSNAGTSSPTQRETIQCPTGMVAVGMVGYVGGILDRIGFRCGTISGADQAAVTITSSASINYGSTLTLSSSGGSGSGATTYSATGNCSVSGTTLTATGNAGTTCSVTATRAADTNYASMASSIQTVTIQKISNTISFTNPGPRTWSSTQFNVVASATSGATPTISSSTSSVCTSSGLTVTMVASGSCTLVASDASNTNYNAGANVTQTFTINPTGRSGFTGNSSTISGTSTGSKYVVERFTSSGSWTVPQGVASVEYLIVGGGGAGGTAFTDASSGGGGGGQVVTGSISSPLSSSYTITVGAGGTAASTSPNPGGNGGGSSISTVATVLGGGGGSSFTTGGSGTAPTTGFTGGGGGSWAESFSSGSTGSGGETRKGGNGFGSNNADTQSGGGGGGANGSGSNGTVSVGGAGGSGVASSLTGSTNSYGGGGGGGKRTSTGSVGTGTDGGGNGGLNAVGSAGLPNRGGGGGGAGSGTAANRAGGAGGSGIVVVRYALPSVSTPDLADASDSATNNDNITSTRTLTFTGSAPVGASVQLSVATASSTTDTDTTTGTWTNTGSACTADSTTGAWNCITAELAPGLHKVRSTATAILDGVTDTQTSTSALVATIDTTVPTITINRSGNGTLSAGQTDTITFELSETSSNFELADLTVTGGTFSAFTGSGTTYTTTFTPTANATGTASISVIASKFTDTAGNNNTASSATSITYDTSRPTVSMSANPSSISSGATSTVTFTVTESVTTFTSADVSSTFGSLTNFSGSGITYTATFTASPSTGGIAVITVASGSITDANTNANTSAFTFGITVTNTSSSSGGRTSYLSDGTNGTNGTRYFVERFTTAGAATWTAPQGVTTVDVLAIGGGGGAGDNSGGGGSGGGVSFQTSVAVSGTVNLSVGAGGAAGTSNTDNGKNGSATTFGAISSGGGNGGRSNSSTGGASVSGSGAGGNGSTGISVTGLPGANGPSYSITGTPMNYAGGGGGGGWVSDTAGGVGGSGGGGAGGGLNGPSGLNGVAGTNGLGGGGGSGSNSTSTAGAGGSGIVVVRYAVPGVSTPDLDATDDLGINNDNITAATTLTFTGSAPVGSTVQLFVDGLSSGNTCVANISTGAWSCDTGVLTAGDKVITAESRTVLSDSTVTSTSSGLAVTIDTTTPTVTLTRSGTGPLNTGQTETITFTLSEASTTFAADDITVTGGTIGALTTTSSTVYSVVFTPTANTNAGTGSLSVASTRFTDTAGNNNTASSTLSINYDTGAPTVSMGANPASVASGSTTTVTFTVSESTTTFTESDVTATLGTLTGFTGSDRTYTATFTSSRSSGGTAVITVASASFADSATNVNTSSFTFNISVTNTASSSGGRTSYLANGTNGTNGTRYFVEQFSTAGTTTWTAPQGVTSVEYLIVAGGGGGAGGHATTHGGGGGGAGGYRTNAAGQTSGGATSAEAALSVTPGTSYSVVVGSGGNGGIARTAGSNGSTSQFATVVASGGGGGGSYYVGPVAGGSGGGAGASTDLITGANGASGQGYKGGNTPTADFTKNGAGGGGSGGVGANGVDGAASAAGGIGTASSITGTTVTRALGGAGGVGVNSTSGTSATSNTGNGGGGGSAFSGAEGVGGSGGSGLVVVRYAVPGIATPDLDAADDTGTNTDNITSATTLTFTGSAPAGSTVQLLVDGISSGNTCTANNTTGAWSCDTGVLSAGDRVITAQSTTILSDSTVVSTSSGLTVTIDTTTPTVSSVSFTSNSGSDNTYKADDVISITVAFSENVNVTNSPRIALAGLTSKFATYTSGSGTSSLVFSYTVAVGDTDTDGLGISADSLTLNSGTIRDTAANDATLTHSAVTTQSGHKVDTTSPTVSLARTGSGTLRSGQTDTITFTLSEASTDFAVGDITMSGGTLSSFTATSSTVYTVVFTPTADTQSGSGSISVSGTKFTDTAGNNNTASTATAISYDTLAPTVSLARSGSGSLKSGQTDTITFTLSEASTDFAVGDITMSGGTLSSFTATSSTVYTVVFTPTADTQSGSGSISVSGTKFTDTAGNNNTASTATAISYDTLAPTVSLARSGSGSLKSGQTDTITFTLSEASTDFAVGDITVSGGTLSSFTATSSTVYTVIFTPTADTQSGSGSISVSGTKFTDTAGNNNTASTATAISYDTLAPTVSHARTGSGTLRSGQTDTITFTLSEASTDFAVGDITVSGGTLSSFTATSSTVYTVVFTPTADTQSGSGSISVSGTKFTDTAGNNNTASTATAISYDTLAPTVSHARTGSGTLRSGQTDTITFTLSEASTDFAVGDITVSGGTLSSFTATSSTVYTVIFTPTADTQSGTGSISVAGATFTDTAGNSNTVSSATSISYDTLAPTVSLVRSGSGTLNSTQTSTITFTLSEASSTFAADDITVAGGSIGTLTTTSSTVYSVVFTPTSNTQSGTGSISVAGAKFIDTAGNNNTASTVLSISFDTAAPTVTITRAGSVLRSGITEQITFTLSEASSTFAADDITVAGGSIGGLTTTSSTVYYVQFTPTTNTQSGTGSISVAGATFTDAAGNTNTASSTTSFAYDTLAPTVSLVRTGSGPLKAGQTDSITMTFSEIGSFNGFTSSGATLSNFRYILPNVYAIDFTPTASTQTGSGSVSVLAGNFTDDVGNTNAESNVNFTYDTLVPTVTVSRSYSGSIGVRANQTITFTLSEASSTFTAADITVTGGSIGSLTTVSSTVYTVRFTPTADTESGTSTLSVAAAKFTDSAGNDNTASNTLSIPFDTREPTLAITRAGSTSLRSGQTDIITFTLSEASSTFTAADITVSGGSIGTLTTTSSTVYSVVFTPTTNTQSGTGSISVAAAMFTDATGNGNIASSTRSVPFDTLAATISNVTSSTANGTLGIGSSVSIQVAFSEAVIVSATPRLTLETGATDRVASHTSGSGTDTLTFTYTVQSGDTSGDLDYTSTSALALNGGTILDSVGNTATLTLPAPGTSGSLGANKAIVVASEPTQIVSVREPVGTAAGAAFDTQPQVSLKDSGGAVVTSDSSTVITATVGSGASLVGARTATAVSGIAAFSNLGISGTAGTSYLITYSATVNGNALTVATQSVTPTVGAATQISITTQPVGDTAGALLSTQPVAKVLDSGNNVVTGSSIPVTVSASGGTLGGTKIVNANNGVATFAGLTFVGTASTNYTLTFTTANLGSAISNNFSVGVGAPTQIIRNTSASGAVYGQDFTTQPVLEIRDAGNNKVSSATNVVTATLSSGNVVGTSNTSLAATAAGGVATFSGLGITGTPGDYTITYSSGALTTASQSITLIKANQTIAFTDPTDRAWAAAAIEMSPITTSGLTVTLTSTSTDVCTVSGLNVTMVKVGTCSLTASQTGNSFYNAATSVSHSFDISQASQSISFDAITNRPWSASTFVVSPTTTSGLTVNVTSGTTGVCSVSNATVTMLKAGTCELTASQSGSTNYSAATSVPRSFEISLATQDSFSITSLAATYEDDLTLTTLGGSGSGAVTYIKVSGDCTLLAGTLTPTAAGSCEVTATKAADTQYASASATQAITINKANQSVALTLGTSSVIYGQTLTLTGSGGEGNGAISYSVSEGTCTLNTAVLTPGDAGSICKVRVTRAESANYNSLTSHQIVINVTRATLTLGTLALSTKTFGDSAFALTGPSATYDSASVAGTWSYSSAQTSVATIEDSTATVTGGGTSVITATFSPTDSVNFNSANTASTLTVEKATPTFSWSNVLATYSDADFTIVSPAVATTAAAGTWSYSSADTAVIAISSTKFDVGIAGSSVVTATFTPSSTTNYVSGGSITMTVTVQRANQAALLISSTSGTYGTDLTLTTTGGTTDATITWGVSNDSATGCAISSGKLATTSIGTCTVTATMAGSDNYNSVTNSGTTVTIGAKPITVTAIAKTKTYGDTDPALTYTTATGALVGQDTLTGSLTRVTGDTVGEYTINQGTVTNTNNTNYDITYTTAKLTIGAKPITVTAVAKIKTYGDNDPALTFTTPTGALVGQDTLTGTPTRVAGENVGEYTINQGTVANTNYDITFTTAKLTINAKPITVTAVAKTKTFGDNDPTLTITIPTGSLVGSDTLTGTPTRVAGENVGEYTINQGTVANTNYDITFTTAKLTIDHRLITITADDQIKIYGDNDPALTYEVTNGTLANSNDLTGSLIRAAGEDVGEYTINKGTVANANYTISYVSDKLTIGAKPITVTAVAKTKTYGDTDPALTFTTPAGALVSQDTLTGSLTRVAGDTVGEYTINQGTVTNTNNTNYDITYMTAKLTIAAKPITVTAVAKTKTYGDTDPALTFTTATGALVDQDTLTGSLTRVTGDTVGEYTINQGTVTNTNNTNYDITYTTAKLTINAKPITVTAVAKTKTYGDNDPALTITIPTGSLVGSDTLIGTPTRVTGNTVGEYTINQGSIANNNYDITFTTAKLTIGAKPITVTAVAKTKTYGDNDPALTYTTAVGALVGSDTLTGTPTRVTGENVGEYTINQGTVTNTDNTNYDITYVTAKLTIGAKPITVTAVAKNKTYGDNDPALTFTTAVGALVGSDTLTGSLTRVTGDTVGEYTINQGTVTNTNNTNYDLTYTTAKLTIGAKPITISANAQTKIYGETDPALTITIPTGSLVGSDVLTGTPTRVAGEDAGEYTINKGTVANPNYNITFTTAKLTIGQAQQSALTVTTANIVYRTPIALQASGGSEGELSFSVATAGTASCSIDNGTLSASGNAGSTCTVTATRATTNNYVQKTSAPFTITVVPRTITLTATAKEKFYGDSDPGFTYVVTAGSLFGSDTFSGTQVRETGENVGTYAINKGLLANSNYTITYVSAQLTINQRPITVTAANKTKIFTESDPALTYTVTTGNIVNSDVFIGAITRAPGETLGSYNITRGTLDNGNYSITFVRGTFRITGAQQTGFVLTSSANSVVYNESVTLQTSGGNGDGAVSYASAGGTGSCSISGDSVTGTTAGTCSVTATKAAEGGYLESISDAITITVEKADQAIVFSEISDRDFSTTSITVAPTSGSSSQVILASRTPNVCKVDALAIEMKDSGNCSIAASVAESRNHNAAPSIVRSFSIRAVVPFAPAITSVEPSDATVTVAFTPGLSGGAAITTYRYSVDDGVRWTDLPDGTITSPIVIGNLPNDIEAKVRIMAVNRVGAGARSNLKSATPVAKKSIVWATERKTNAVLSSAPRPSVGIVTNQLPPRPALVSTQSVSGGRRTQVTATRATKDSDIPVTHAIITVRLKSGKLLARIQLLVDPSNPTTAVTVPYQSRRVNISVQFANNVGISDGGTVGANLREGTTFLETSIDGRPRLAGTPIANGVSFSKGSSVLTAPAKARLKKALKTAQAQGGLIYITGYTQSGELKNSWLLNALARERAKKVAEYFVSLGARQWITFHGASIAPTVWHNTPSGRVDIATVFPDQI